jgi:periplasmic divalent cation tolerance protein
VIEGPILVYITAPGMDLAAAIARALVEERLAAGCNISSGLRSIYRWEGQIWDEAECFIVIQSQRHLFEDLRQRVLSLHPYKVPKIIAVDIAQGHGPYLDWIAASCRPD